LPSFSSLPAEALESRLGGARDDPELRKPFIGARTAEGMHYSKRFKEAVAAYQPRVEELFETNLGSVEVLPLVGWRMLRLMCAQERAERPENGSRLQPMPAIAVVANAALNWNFAYIAAAFRVEDHGIIAYTRAPHWRGFSEANIAFVAAHELAHLAHYDALGNERFWALRDDFCDPRERLADTVAGHLVGRDAIPAVLVDDRGRPPSMRTFLDRYDTLREYVLGTSQAS
jgi:hypothetical protein